MILNSSSKSFCPTFFVQFFCTRSFIKKKKGLKLLPCGTLEVGKQNPLKVIFYTFSLRYNQLNSEIEFTLLNILVVYRTSRKYLKWNDV